MTQVGLSYSIQTLLQVGQVVQVLFEVFSSGANSRSKILEGVDWRFGMHSVWGSRSDRQLYSIRYRLCSDVEILR
jgi:hypothetical protein